MTINLGISLLNERICAIGTMFKILTV